MFIHWGLYAIVGHGEWVMNRERIPLNEYVKLAGMFRADKYNPKEWAQLAVDAGMRYMVLTTKHHEGFCLWNSRLCKFNAVNSAAKRDLLAEFVEAVRGAGLKVGLYYSLGDWYNPDWAAGWKGDEAAEKRFIDYTHGLVEELVTNYGRIDIMWYDLPQCYTAAEWRSVELNARVRELQPHIVINNRAMTPEDFGTPEQHISARGEGRMWEACMTLNEKWGYCPYDTGYKSPRQVVELLAVVASGAGNLLLNVGPDPRGQIPVQAQEILRRVGKWLAVHGESIYGSERHGLMWNLWGPCSRKGNTLYIHQSTYFGDTLVVGGLTNTVLNATLLCTGKKLTVKKRGSQTVISGLPKKCPDELMCVIRLDLDGPPDQDISRVINRADVFPDLPN
jgi:alpha-L-fucosidase